MLRRQYVAVIAWPATLAAVAFVVSCLMPAASMADAGDQMPRTAAPRQSFTHSPIVQPTAVNENAGQPPTLTGPGFTSVFNDFYTSKAREPNNWIAAVGLPAFVPVEAQPVHLYEGENLQAAFDEEANLVIVLVGHPVDDPRFLRQFVWVESAPIYVSDKHSSVHLSVRDVTAILEGRKTDWKELGSGSGPIRLYAMGEPLRERRLACLIRSITKSGLPVSDPPFHLEPTYEKLARAAGADENAMVFGLLYANPSGLVEADVDGISIDGAVLAQPDLYWHIAGVIPTTVPRLWNPIAADQRLLIDETSALNPDPPPDSKSRPAVPAELARRVYPLRQSVYLYLRRGERGSPAVDPRSDALEKTWLEMIGRNLQSVSSQAAPQR